MLRYAVVPLVLLAACNEQLIAPPVPPPTAPGAPAPAIAAAANDDGPPSSQRFGRDHVAVGSYTGEGITSTGLACRITSADVRTCSGFLASDVDGTRLDVTLELPRNAPKPTPLVVLIHGYAGSKTSSGDLSQPLIDAGYAVLRYSTRGFGDSWGQVNLVDVSAEVADLRSMIAQVVDRNSYHLDASAVAVTGASYGGGHSWLAALQPTFTTPLGTVVQIRTIVPIAAWSDLLYALIPNGRERASIDHPGGAKLSYINGLYASGWRLGENPDRPYDNYPDYFKAWHATINTEEPNDLEPIFRGAVNGLAGYRSVWWQQSFWYTTAVPARLPIFIVQGFTDDLFPLPEAKRMVYALQSIDAAYPVTLYLGDIGHPRASNKTGEVDYVLGLIKRWLAFYLTGQGTPPTGVYAALTRPRTEPFSAGNVITAPTLDALATETDSTSWDAPTVLVNPVADPWSSFVWDPLLMAGAEELEFLPALREFPLDPSTFTSYKVALNTLSGPGALTIAGQPIVRFHAFAAAYRVQINARLFDYDPATRTKELVTRGTYTLESAAPGLPIGDADVSLATYGNLWHVEQGHELWLELTNVDSPYITPSRIPSATAITGVRLVVPARRTP